MSKRVDVVGKTYGMLLVLEHVDGISPNEKYLCQCECGKEAVVRKCHITSGHTRSCGCYHDTILTAGLRTKHGMARTPTYECWKGMKQRCYQPSAASYKSHGARGITVCDRWRNSFELFLEDMGTRPDGLTLDRIDNNGNYEPANCKWSTPKEQGNNKRNNKFYTVAEVTKNLEGWTQSTGLTRQALSWRLSAGMTMEQAINWTRDRHTIKMLYKGDQLTIDDAARITGLSRGTIQSRHRAGWSPEEIIETPALKRRRS